MDHKDMLTKATALEEAVEDALQVEAALAGHPVNVAVQGATVTLSGTVDHQQAKDQTTQIARGVQGVLDVINELVVVGHDAGNGAFLTGHDRRQSDASHGNDGSGMSDLAMVAGAISSLGGAAGNGVGIGYAGLGVLVFADEHLGTGRWPDENGTGHEEDTEEVKG